MRGENDKRWEYLLRLQWPVHPDDPSIPRISGLQMAGNRERKIRRG